MKSSNLSLKVLAFTTVITAALLSTGSAQAQTSATGQADAFATIAQAMTITKVTDLNFGIVISAAGTVQVAAQAAPPTVTYSGVTGVTGGTISAAEFDVTGTANAVYAVTTPVGSITLQEAGGNTMTADTFTAGSASGTFTLDGTGADTIYVGATLNVSAGLNPGLYTSVAPFNVTVDYN